MCSDFTATAVTATMIGKPVARTAQLLSALQATEDALPGMRVALCATRQIDRAATNHQDREDEDQQVERIGGDRELGQ